MKSPFVTDHTPSVGIATNLTEGLRVVTADNPGPMTFTGTQTYILGEGDVAVIDPGPNSPAHLAAIERALVGEKISHILVTHSHLDHSPLAALLSARTGAPVYGFGAANAARSELMSKLAEHGDLGGREGIDPDFKPDVLLRDGDQIFGSSWALTALHTPGHLSNHLCFAWEGHDAIFSGDHVMGWATTLISPPDGDLTAFMASLRRLQDRPEDFYYPGHGAGIFDAHGMLDYQLGHRLGREDQILAELGKGPRDILAITSVIYADIDKRLHGAASRNVLAHIVDLYERGLVAPQGVFSANTTFGLV